MIDKQTVDAEYSSIDPVLHRSECEASGISIDSSLATLQSLRQPDGNGFDFNEIFPCLRFASNQPLAQWQARVRLGSLLIELPHCLIVSIRALRFLF